MDRFEWIATAAFGLEGVVARELARLGLDAKAENGGARFFGTFEDAFRANLHACLLYTSWLRLTSARSAQPFSCGYAFRRVPRRPPWVPHVSFPPATLSLIHI